MTCEVFWWLLTCQIQKFDFSHVLCPSRLKRKLPVSQKNNGGFRIETSRIEPAALSFCALFSGLSRAALMFALFSNEKTFLCTSFPLMCFSRYDSSQNPQFTLMHSFMMKTLLIHCVRREKWAETTALRVAHTKQHLWVGIQVCKAAVCLWFFSPRSWVCKLCNQTIGHLLK